jgi:hypothetical protein
MIDELEKTSSVASNVDDMFEQKLDEKENEITKLTD